MKKISTLFKKDPNDLGRVINEIDPQNQWVIDGEGIPTRKWDGTAVAIINGELYKRYDAKHGKPSPIGGIPCQDPDPITGHWPHWIKCDRNNPADKYHFEGFDYYASKHPVPTFQTPITYELVGPKINGNKEKYTFHLLLIHGMASLSLIGLSFEDIGWWLENHDVEGIVFHHKSGDGRMCKIRKSDFGIKR